MAGGGIVGWTAAATIAKRLPGLQVTIVPTPPPGDALADRIGCTLPSAVEFHRDIGIEEADLLKRAGGCFRLGTSFEGWAEGLPDYVHCYGDYGRSIGAAAFHHHWVRTAGPGSADGFDSYSAAAAMARANRFAHPAPDPASPFSTFEYGLRLDPTRYADYIRAYARFLRVAERPGPLAGIRLREGDGFIEALRLGDGSEVTGDLFIDCTGPAAQLHSALGGGFDEWAQWLPADRILFAQTAPQPDLPVLDRAVALPAGWRFESAGLARTSHGFVYSSGYLSDGKAERVLRGATGAEPALPPVQLRQGRRSEPWLRNCVAIGDASVSVEPLEWTNLHLVHGALDRMVSMMPDRDCAAIELQEYNRQCAAEADRVRDFLVMHYVRARKSRHDLWRAAAAVEPPASLAHTIELFEERGILPFYEEETFPRDSWVAVLIGQGAIPRRFDPIAETVPPDAAERNMKKMRDGLKAMVPQLPTHPDYLRSLLARAPR